MSRALLITGATGSQGGAVIDALLRRAPEFTILAATPSVQSPSALRLAAKSPSVKLVEGDLLEIPALLSSARKAAGAAPLWGVYSVQASMGEGVTLDGEVQQGKELIDESVKAGVERFVYRSVERGGDEKSWDNPTPVPHFRTKHLIEHHLRDSTAHGKSKMGWTILRPAMFMDNLEPGFPSNLFLTILRDTMKEKPLQWLAASDLGFFTAEAFKNPGAWDKKAVGLAGDQLTFNELSERFRRVTGKPAGTTVGLLGMALKFYMSEMGAMANWFRDEGYRANIEEVRRAHPKVMTMETWLRTKSAFVKSEEGETSSL